MTRSYHIVGCQEKLQQMIDEYHAGSINVETSFKKLVEFSRSLQEEDRRAIRENLSEEELAIFGLLTKPNMKLTKKQEAEVKKVAEELLETLKREELVLDWRKRQQSRAAVRHGDGMTGVLRRRFRGQFTCYRQGAE